MAAAHKPTPETRKAVLNMALAGFAQDAIIKVLGIGSKITLGKHYRKELDQGSTLATSQVAGRLFEKCLEGDTASMIFWMKTRAGWREKSDFNLTSEDGSMTPPKVITVRGVKPE